MIKYSAVKTIWNQASMHGRKAGQKIKLQYRKEVLTELAKKYTEEEGQCIKLVTSSTNDGDQIYHTLS